MSILDVKALRKEYPSFLLDDISFSLQEGQITGFIGRNGAGKSTTLKSILGYCHANGGEVCFFDRPFSGNETAIKEEIGYISGGFDFYPNKKLKAITAVARSFYKQWDDAEYRRCLSLFSLDENKTPAKLSAGMKVKYALTLALSHRAKLLIHDEPTSGLDPISRDELLEIFWDLKEKGTTILFSTHIISDLEQCADRILYIRGGKLCADAALTDFRASYRLAEMTAEEKDRNDPALLLGCRGRNGSYTALVAADHAAKICGNVAPADLETIMIHLEREG